MTLSYSRLTYVFRLRSVKEGEIYRILKEHQEAQIRQGKRLRKLIGLAEDSTPEEVESRLDEMREYFIEINRSWQVRKRKVSDVQPP